MVVTQYQEAHAIAIPLVIGGALLVGAAACLVASGLQMNSVSNLESSAQDWYRRASSTIKESFITAAEAQVGAQIGIPTNVWQDVVSWTRSKFVVGTNTATVNFSTYKEGEYEYYANTVYNPVTGLMSAGNEVHFNSKVYTFGAPTNYGSYTRYYIKENGVNTDRYIDVKNGYEGQIDFLLIYSSIGDPVNEQIGLSARFFSYAQNMWYRQNLNYVVYRSQLEANNSLAQANTTYAANGLDVMSNTSYDYVTPEGVRNVAVPTTMDWLVDKTYTDVQNPTDTVPGDTTVPDTDLGALQGIWQNVARFFDFTSPVNWEPLKVSGDLFTNAFPFSLPWDLFRSFSTLASDTGQPDFTLSFPGTKLMPEFNLNIDLSIFDDLMPFMKTAELIAFDIGLVLLTRKLLGGAV